MSTDDPRHSYDPLVGLRLAGLYCFRCERARVDCTCAWVIDPQVIIDLAALHRDDVLLDRLAAGHPAPNEDLVLQVLLDELRQVREQLRRAAEAVA